MSLGRLLLYPLRGQGGLLSLLSAVGLYALVVVSDWARGIDSARLLMVVFLPVPGIITVGVFQHYAWASLRHVAAGHDETIRSIEIEAVSPLTNFLAFKVAALLFGLAGLVAACFSLNILLGSSVVAVLGIALPALLGVMVLEERFFAGLDPKHVVPFALGLGPVYIVFALLLYGGIAALYVTCVAMSPPNVYAVLVGSYAFVLGHVLAGRVLYVSRDRIGLSTLPEKDPLHVAQVADAKTIDALMVDLHRLCAVDRVDRANKMLEGFLQKDNYALDERIHQRLELFHDKRLQLEHSWHYLHRLLAANKVSRAWSLMRRSLAMDPLFRPDTAASVLTLIAAAPAVDADCVDTLLGDFERAYPDSERLPEALFEHARWLVTKLERLDAALELLLRIEREFPEWAEDPQYRAFGERIRRHAKGVFLR